MTQPVLEKLFAAFDAVKDDLNTLLWWLPAEIIKWSKTMVNGVAEVAKALGDKAPELVSTVTDILKGLGDAIGNSTGDGELGMTELAAIGALIWLFK